MPGADARPVRPASRPAAPAANGLPPFTLSIAQLQRVIDEAHRCATAHLAQLGDTHGGSRQPLPLGHGLMILAIFRWNLGAIGHKEFCTVIADQCAAVLNRACSDPEARGHLADLIGIEERTIADWVQPEPLQRALLHAKPIRDLPRQLKELGLHGRRRRRR